MAGFYDEVAIPALRLATQQHQPEQIGGGETSFHGWLLQGAPYLLGALWLSLRAPSAVHGTAAQRSGLRGLAVVMTGCWPQQTRARRP